MATSTASGQLAGRYAAALFELADEKKQLSAVAGDLDNLGKALDSSDDLQRLIRSPVIGRAPRTAAVTGVLDALKASAVTRNFIGAVAANARLFALPDMIKAFQAELSRRSGEVTAQVTSARALTKEQISALESQLKTVVGPKVKLEASVDESLMGGLVVRVGSRMIDSSLKSKLAKLQTALVAADTAQAA